MEEKLDVEEYFKSMKGYAQDKLDIYDIVANMIIDARMQPKSIVNLLSKISSETAWDITLYLNYKKYLNHDEEWFVTDSLIKIYCNDFEKESKNGEFEKRLNLKSNSNKRIISTDEMFMVLHRRTNYLPYVEQEFVGEDNVKLYQAWKSHNHTRMGQKLYNAMKKELLNLPSVISDEIKLINEAGV